MVDPDDYWVNNPLISPINKALMYDNDMHGAAVKERYRIIDFAKTLIDDLRGHDGECDCKHDASVLEDFINHPEFKGEM